MASHDETFLGRWSRLKRAVAAQGSAPAAPPTAGPGAAAPVQPADLPPVESLDLSSDFSVFMRPEVDPSLKRDALKKLFQSPQFNEMDGLDVYIDDYNKFEPISEEMLKQLEHTRELLFGNTQANGEAEQPDPALETHAEQGSVPQQVDTDAAARDEPPDPASDEALAQLAQYQIDRKSDAPTGSQ